MISKARYFEFNSYQVSSNRRQIDFNYRLSLLSNEILEFNEKIILHQEIPISIDSKLFDFCLYNVHLILGISYWKLYCPTDIRINTNPLSVEQADFWNIVYTKGLGEFFYRNKIDYHGLIKFPYQKGLKSNSIQYKAQNRSLVPLGGGKDSLLSIELLKKAKKDITATGFSSILTNSLVKHTGVSSFFTERLLDSKILNKGSLTGAFEGHIPISAVYAFVNLLNAVIFDYRYIILSNERSANFGNIQYLGQEINHQWSKSYEFEMLFQNYVERFITPGVIYFSLLRPYSELKIVQLFSQYQKYFPFFSSCNRNFSRSNPLLDKKWCGKCAKCIFVFTLLSAFISKQNLVNIFKKDLYQDSSLISLFKDILGFGKIKPFDCVGTFDEVQVAMYLAHKKGEYDNEAVMKMYVNEILPNIKNIEKIKDEVLTAGRLSSIPNEFHDVFI